MHSGDVTSVTNRRWANVYIFVQQLVMLINISPVAVDRFRPADHPGATWERKDIVRR